MHFLHHKWGRWKLVDPDYPLLQERMCAVCGKLKRRFAA